MGFLFGRPAFAPAPLHSHPFPPSSPACSPLLPWSHRKIAKKKVTVTATASQRNEDESASLQRRAVLLVGISLLPILELRAIAMEGRGVRRGVRNFDEIRKRTQEKQNIGSAEVQLLREPVKEPSQSEVDLQKQQISSEDSSSVSQKEDGRITEEQIPKLQEEKTSSRATNQAEEAHPQVSSGSSFLSFVNGIGIVGSGALGALYATSQKEKSEIESTVQSMELKLNESEEAVALLKKDYETRLLNEQEERRKQVRRLREEEASLSGQLASANGKVAALCQELQNEKILVEDLKEQIGQLESDIAQTGENKKLLEAKLKERMNTFENLQNRVNVLTLEKSDKEKIIENLRLSLAGKESECKNFISIIDKTKTALSEANSTVELLKDENVKIKDELNLKFSIVDELNEKIMSLDAERASISKRLHNLMKEYDDLKSSAERRAALDSELLSKGEEKLRQLEEKLEVALSESDRNQTKIAQLTKEKDDVRVILEKEINNVKNIKSELCISQEALEASRSEASGLSKELEESRRSCEELTSNLLKIQDEFSEAKKLLSGKLEEVKSSLNVLSKELAAVKGALKSTTDELAVTSNELKAVMEERESLKKELMDISKKAETSVHELKEERKTAFTLSRELEVLTKQLQKDSDARRALEADLDEATKSLDEMNKSALLLSRELEDSNSRTSNLEVEKEVLYKSLMEQKNMTEDAKENLEDAQNLITRLGRERESLEKRSKTLEDDLASAKGEILRLRREINMTKESVKQQHQTNNEIAAGTPFAARKTASRRRKGGATSDGS